MGLRTSFSIFATSHAKRLFLFEKNKRNRRGGLRQLAVACLRLLAVTSGDDFGSSKETVARC